MDKSFENVLLGTPELHEPFVNLLHNIMDNNAKFANNLDKLNETFRNERLEQVQKEQDIESRITDKLKTDNQKAFHERTFDILRKTKFKNLSFLSDILEDWDLSVLTGRIAILKGVSFNLSRDTDEIDLYDELFQQLGYEKLVYFLVQAVIGEELDESVIDAISGRAPL